MERGRLKEDPKESNETLDVHSTTFMYRLVLYSTHMAHFTVFSAKTALKTTSTLACAVVSIDIYILAEAKRYQGNLSCGDRSLKNYSCFQNHKCHRFELMTLFHNSRNTAIILEIFR